MLTRLSEGEASVSELAKPFNMALPSFMQHLGVLEKCGLVCSRKEGRARIYALMPNVLEQAENWLGQRRSMWEKRLNRLDAYLYTLKENDYD